MSNDRQQKTTAVVLGIFTCVFMCAMGYQIIGQNQTKIKSSPSPKLVSRNEHPVQMSKASLSRYLEDEDEDVSYELKILRNQNRKQAKKIKALKEEIVHRLQEQHDLKATLFKQEGDPRDRSRIAELNQQLAQKEVAMIQLQHRLKELEGEKQAFDRKMLHAEVAQEALTNMLEQVRTVRDQEIGKLKSQLAEYQVQKDREQTALTVQLLQYEDTQQMLRESLDQNDFAKFYLDAEINHLQAELEVNRQERDEKEKGLSEKLYDAIAALELSEIEIDQLKKRLQKAYVRHHQTLKENGEKIAQLQRELSESQGLIDQKSEELVREKERVEGEYRSRIEALIGVLDQEKEQKKEIEKQLAEQLGKWEHEKSLHEGFKHEMGELEREHRNQITELRQQIENESQRIASLEKALEHSQERLELEKSERTKAEVGLLQLAEIEQVLRDQYNYSASLEHSLDASHQRLTELEEHLERYQAELQEKEVKIAEHSELHVARFGQLERQLEQHKSDLNDKERAVIALEETKQQIEEQLRYYQDQLQEKEAKLAEHTDRHAARMDEIENQLEQHKRELNDKERAIIALEETKQQVEEQLRHYRDELQEKEAKLAEHTDLHAARMDEIENQLEQHKRELNEKERAVVALEGTKQQMEEQLRRYRDELHEKEADLTERLRDHEVGLAEMQHHINHLREELSQREKAIGFLEQSRKQLEEESQDQAARLERYQSLLREREREYRSQQENYYSSLGETHAATKLLESELDQARLEKEHAELRIAELEDQVKLLMRSARARETAEAKRFERFFSN